MLQGMDNPISVILCNPSLDVQSLHGLVQIQRKITLEFPGVSEWQGPAKLGPSALLQTSGEDHVRALLQPGSFELVREAQELRDLCNNAAKGQIWCGVVRIERVPRPRVIELVV